MLPCMFFKIFLLVSAVLCAIERARERKMKKYEEGRRPIPPDLRAVLFIWSRLSVRMANDLHTRIMRNEGPKKIYGFDYVLAYISLDSYICILVDLVLSILRLVM